MKHFATAGSAFFSLGIALAAPPETKSFYQDPLPLFSTRPSETASSQNIKRFGPIGLSIDLVQPAFTMMVAEIEAGSPAAKTGKFQKGQIIVSVNGEVLKDIDPRMQMAQWIEKAEASDGKLTFSIKDLAEPVVVELPVLGPYSKTWPLDCPKSDKIVRNLAEYIKSDPSHHGLGDLGMWFLMSTGDPSDTEAVGKWARTYKSGRYAWHIGFGGVPLCEYYLRTGDKEVLPVIQATVNEAVAGQYNDAWAGRGGVPGLTYGMGHLNAAGTAVVTFLMLAKECGADVPEQALQGALRHFYRYAGRGGNPYGDDRPEVGFVDNGKSGNLAFAMAAAAALTPDGENSLYAKARDTCAMTSFYSTSFMLHGHTGGGIGEIWRSASMSLLKEKKPAQYRDFVDNRRWHYELSRRFDGSFGILGGGGYDVENWGVAYGLVYTVPRKTMRITGAPPTRFSKPYQLPKQPWGVEADNEFLSLDPVPMPDGTMIDLSKEILATDASIPFLRKIHAKEEISDDLIRHYIHHQDAVIRSIAAAKAMGINQGYIGWLEPGGKPRPALVMEFLQSKSPRVRRAMFAALENIARREKKPELITPDIVDLALQSVENPQESWWVKDAALQILALASPDRTAPHVDTLLSFLKIDDWWIQNAAMKALAPLSADPRTFQKVLPPLGEIMRGNQRAALTLGFLPEIRQHLQSAPAEVQQLAVSVLKESFSEYAGVPTAPGGLDISSTITGHLEHIAGSLAEMPGGLDVLYEISTKKNPQQILPYKELFLQADPSRFGPTLKKAIKPIIMDELIPEYVGRNRKKIQESTSLEKQDTSPGGSGDPIDELVALYDRAGLSQYNWKEFLNLREADWQYHSFDPKETLAWDISAQRYRDITLPPGLENWMTPAFDAAKAGWKTGKSPFGQFNGKIPQGILSKCSDKCVGPVCYGTLGAHTLWEKEVILLRGTFQVPPLKEGHRYRVVVNDRVHVGNGGGYAIYVNGKLLVEQPKTIGRGQGEMVNGAFVTKEFLDDFKGGKVTFAVKSFLRFNDKRDAPPTEKIPQGLVSLHMDEQPLPPIGDEFVIQSARIVPMTTSEWDTAMSAGEASKETDPESLRFRWDGKWVANESVMGEWTVLTNAASPETFVAPAKPNAKNPFVSSLSLTGQGKTNEALLLWSGNHLLDLNRYEALKMQVHSINGADYLFVESGNFRGQTKPHWEQPWLVFTRK